MNNCPKNGKVFRGKYQFLSEKIQNFINCRTENHQKNSTTANSFYNWATGKRFKFGGDKPLSARKITHFGVIQQVAKSVLIGFFRCSYFSYVLLRRRRTKYQGVRKLERVRRGQQ